MANHPHPNLPPEGEGDTLRVTTATAKPPPNFPLRGKETPCIAQVNTFPPPQGEG